MVIEHKKEHGQRNHERSAAATAGDLSVANIDPHPTQAIHHSGRRNTRRPAAIRGIATSVHVICNLYYGLVLFCVEKETLVPYDQPLQIVHCRHVQIVQRAVAIRKIIRIRKAMCSCRTVGLVWNRGPSHRVCLAGSQRRSDIQG